MALEPTPPPPLPAAPPPLRQLVYTSSADFRHDPRDLEDILAVSRPNNRDVAVTGLLLYYENHFIQCLEGPPQAVADIMARIHTDARHRHVSVFMDHTVAERSFPRWDMACTPLSESYWLRLATVEWQAHRQETARTGRASPGLDLLLKVWDDATALDLDY